MGRVAESLFHHFVVHDPVHSLCAAHHIKEKKGKVLTAAHMNEGQVIWHEVFSFSRFGPESGCGPAVAFGPKSEKELFFLFVIFWVQLIKDCSGPENEQRKKRQRNVNARIAGSIFLFPLFLLWLIQPGCAHTFLCDEVVDWPNISYLILSSLCVTLASPLRLHLTHSDGPGPRNVLNGPDCVCTQHGDSYEWRQ